MCDGHLDAISCMQSAISRGFYTDQLRSPAQLNIDHGFFLSEEEADTVLRTGQENRFLPLCGFCSVLGETCMYTHLIISPVRSMDGLSTSAVMRRCHLLCGFGMQKCPKITNCYVRQRIMRLDYS